MASKSTAAMTYKKALNEARKVGVGVCSDQAAMAAFCDSLIQVLCGAVSPRLVWEGAMKRGMTNLELGRLAGTDPSAVADLMWVE
jgi:hypothetical protein